MANDGDNIVWGTAAEGDNIVWGTAADGDNIVWGTDNGDNIVWGTDDGDSLVWADTAPPAGDLSNVDVTALSDDQIFQLLSGTTSTGSTGGIF
jgi:hypothetical protein